MEQELLLWLKCRAGIGVWSGAKRSSMNRAIAPARGTKNGEGFIEVASYKWSRHFSTAMGNREDKFDSFASDVISPTLTRVFAWSRLVIL
jgi:hypothetical protein